MRYFYEENMVRLDSLASTLRDREVIEGHWTSINNLRLKVIDLKNQQLEAEIKLNKKLQEMDNKIMLARRNKQGEPNGN